MLGSILRPLSLAGRDTRGAYWIAVVAAWLGIMAASILMFFAGGVWAANAPAAGAGDWVAFGIFVAAVLYAVWVMVAAAVRRLHDRGKSGWWSVPLLIVPLAVNEAINFQTRGQADLDLYQQIAVYVTLALGIWGFIEIGCLKGGGGANRFGPPPQPVAWLTPNASNP